jgi:hypothetical protein
LEVSQVTDQRQERPVYCPRCGKMEVGLGPYGGYVAFCMRCLAFLLPNEFAPDDLERLEMLTIGERIRDYGGNSD